MMNNIIAIDGPSGAGKSTVSKILSKRLNMLYIDTGAMYRALTYKLLSEGVNISSDDKYEEFLADTNILFEDNKINLDGKNLFLELRTKEIDEKVSIIASNKYIRDFLSRKQIEIAHSQPSIVDGRDVGTILFPDAILKIYLTADVNSRANRRYKQNLSKNISTQSVESLKKTIILRDEFDTNRKIAPLKKAVDAIEIDSTNLSLEQVVNKIETIYKERVKGNV